ncbi:MAG: RnfABCDGE type electron transport complex subunit D, partial [Candidatus Hydrogenedentota bacterium]
MKIVSDALDALRPLFENGGRLALWRPVFHAADNFFFSAVDKTTHVPFGRDPLEIKRYMSLVILALMPSFISSVCFFGLRVVIMIIVAYVAGGVVEVLFAVIRKEEINEGFLVSGFIFPLILPPGLPLWMVAVGMVFGILIGKEIFGGTGRNLFNPALLGRCFLALGYPAAMTRTWLEPSGVSWRNIFSNISLGAPDAVTSATPLVLAKRGELTEIFELFVGRVAGSAGETSAVAILVGGLFLVWIGIAHWRTVVGVLASFVCLSSVLRAAYPGQVSPILFNLLSGGV